MSAGGMLKLWFRWFLKQQGTGGQLESSHRLQKRYNRHRRTSSVHCSCIIITCRPLQSDLVVLLHGQSGPECVKTAPFLLLIVRKGVDNHKDNLQTLKPAKFALGVHLHGPQTVCSCSHTHHQRCCRHQAIVDAHNSSSEPWSTCLTNAELNSREY